MAYVISLLLLCVFASRAHTLVPGFGPVISRDSYKPGRKVFTTRGKECKFPFRQGGRIHHHCITFLSSQPWCSLTHNFDRDRQFGFCAADQAQPEVFVQSSSRGVSDPCGVDPCQNGGVCALIPHTAAFECSCPERFTGTLCEHKKCYETTHLHYYDTGESWGRIHLRNVEQCTCMAGEIKCERVAYTTCRSNPCQNDGACRLIVSTGQEVCYCRRGYSGPHCSVELDSECYNSRGADYRGVARTTVSGGRCLAWNSDLLYDELHVGTVDASPLRGLGDHAFCRNPDGDKMPWCYTLSDGAISWDYCRLPSCRMAVSSSRRIIPFNLPPLVKTPRPSTPSKRPVCGKRHKKRLAVARGRILGGNSALPGTHPWMVAIYVGERDFCAGTLVSSCWIVSAAHCFFRNPLLSQIRVVLGQQRFNVTDHNARTFGVDKYIFPKQFSVFNPTLHDIVLIKLKKQDGRCAKRTPFISPICLPDKNTTFPDYFCCTISGWGHMHEKAQGYSSLQEAGVRLIPHDTCRKPNVYSNHVTDGMLCAGLGKCADACQGDSGGPLACTRDDVSFLYGIISWGEGCGRSGKPGVYTNVVKYIDWINSVIKRKTVKGSRS
ncbi:hepatocyte growth factor activator isoform X1 [Takifugu flavidus]|uniref:hepatocyte growth factor activator isoform X1 n=1 Tax=Takifugu flavidus TaxID=433684 RepID=UPI002544AEF1|nr:hepatocyte growth factor activator isoform X1 [Takifugu flavidus]